MGNDESGETAGRGEATVASTTDSKQKVDAKHRVVVGTDGSVSADKAVAWAAAQALRTGSVLELVTGFGSGYVITKPSDAKRAMTQVLDAAEDLAKAAAPGVVVKRKSYHGSPETVLIEEAGGADLLVVGSRGLGGFKGRLLGSVSRRCVHRAPCPVVVFRGPREESEGPAPDGGAEETGPAADERSDERGRIVVGIDASPSSIAAVAWAARQAELTGALLEVLMVWELPTSYGMSLPIPSDWDPAHDSEILLEKSLAPIRSAHPELEIQATVIEGHPSLVLEKASNGADLLVVGSRGHGELSGMLLGSVSEHCVVHARCPVLVLRDGNEESEATPAPGPEDR